MDQEQNLYDLGGLDSQSAREHIQQVLMSLKTTQRQIAEKRDQLELWTKRVKLAQDAEITELVNEAQSRVLELDRSLNLRIAEEKELLRGIDIMKAQLANIDAETGRTIDAEALLEQMKNLVGEEPSTAGDELKDLEADAALEALKKKMGMEDAE